MANATKATRKLALGTCSRLPGAELEHPFGEQTDVYKVGGKMFAAVRDEDPALVTLKCDPDDGARLRKEHAGVQPAHYADKKHWITVSLQPEVSQTFVNGLIKDSYRLVVDSLPAKSRPGS